MTTAGYPPGRRRLLRLDLGLLALSQLPLGVWAAMSPAGFFRRFPLPGHAWIALLPPYNEHLVRDVGLLSLSLVVVLVAATVLLTRVIIGIALGAFAVYAVPHAVFHAAHLERFPAVDAWTQTMALLLQLALAAAAAGLAFLGGRPPATGSAEPVG